MAILEWILESIFGQDYHSFRKSEKLKIYKSNRHSLMRLPRLGPIVRQPPRSSSSQRARPLDGLTQGSTTS